MVVTESQKLSDGTNVEDLRSQLQATAESALNGSTPQGWEFMGASFREEYSYEDDYEISAAPTKTTVGEDGKKPEVINFSFKSTGKMANNQPITFHAEYRKGKVKVTRIDASGEDKGYVW